MKRAWLVAAAVGCGGGSSEPHPDAGPPPSLSGCPILPANHVFNTPINGLPIDPHSSDYLTTIGATKVHLDLGQQTAQQASDYYGIPYNTVHGGAMTWATIAYYSPIPAYNWKPAQESDCADASHATVSPCTASGPVLPIPGSPVVEGGINSASNQLPDGDHHLLVVDVDTCTLWETYHAYATSGGKWNIFGSARFDLRSNALRPADWTSADAAGFPILPLLLRADEASTGTIDHALRFTIESSKIRGAYIWPARHQTDGGSSTSLPPMGQLFRLNKDYPIPATASTQSKAILTALKTYGMYLADGGSDLYLSGEPSAAWDDTVFDEVQQVPTSAFEAVDITAITKRSGFDPDSGAVP